MPEVPSPAVAPRYPCPVCLGVKLRKLRVLPDSPLELDRCDRCGGIWFDRGEVAQLRRLEAPGTLQRIVLDADRRVMLCHACGGVMPRDADACPSCGWDNRLDCPVCARAMERKQHDGLCLDVCRHCHGVWFDAIELAAIWNLQLEAFVGRRGPALPAVGDFGAAAEVAGHGVEAAADIAQVLGPHVTFQALGAAVEGGRAVGSAGVEVLSNVPEIAGVAFEATGKLAGAVFEVIAEIVGALAP